MILCIVALARPLVVYQQGVEKRLAFKLVISMKSGENCVDLIDCKSHLDVKMANVCFRDRVRGPENHDHAA